MTRPISNPTQSYFPRPSYSPYFGPGLSALHTWIKNSCLTGKRSTEYAPLLIDATLADAAYGVDVADDAATVDKQPAARILSYESWHVFDSKHHKYFGSSSGNT